MKQAYDSIYQPLDSIINNFRLLNIPSLHRWNSQDIAFECDHTAHIIETSAKHEQRMSIAFCRVGHPARNEVCTVTKIDVYLEKKKNRCTNAHAHFFVRMRTWRFLSIRWFYYFWYLTYFFARPSLLLSSSSLALFSLFCTAYVREKNESEVLSVSFAFGRVARLLPLIPANFVMDRSALIGNWDDRVAGKMQFFICQKRQRSNGMCNCRLVIIYQFKSTADFLRRNSSDTIAMKCLW